MSRGGRQKTMSTGEIQRAMRLLAAGLAPSAVAAEMRRHVKTIRKLRHVGEALAATRAEPTRRARVLLPSRLYAIPGRINDERDSRSPPPARCGGGQLDAVASAGAGVADEIDGESRE